MSNYSGHSGRHDGLQNHSVGSDYPLAVVTYGHDPAIHVVENLTTGRVACNNLGNPLQTSDSATIFQVLGGIVSGRVKALWVEGRPANVGGHLVIKNAKKDLKHELFLALTSEALRIGRDLTPFEAYQVACDFDNR